MDLKESIKEILSEKKARKEGLHINHIVAHIINRDKNLFSDGEVDGKEELKKKITALLNNNVRNANSEFSKVKNPKTNKFKKGWYKLKSTREKPIIPAPKQPQKPEAIDPEISEPKIKDKLFIGKAGECAVMSELLFNGYNANLMMVDDGVDIVANKKNIYYFLQVKTTSLNEQDRIYVTLKRTRFDSFIGNQLRYVVVARCNISGLPTNLYFVFSSTDIERFIFNNTTYANESNIQIKIRIDKENNNRPFIYHETKQDDISFFMNNFNL